MLHSMCKCMARVQFILWPVQPACPMHGLYRWAAIYSAQLLAIHGSCFGDRSFHICGRQSLPSYLWQQINYKQCKRQLKTFLFVSQPITAHCDCLFAPEWVPRAKWSPRLNDTQSQAAQHSRAGSIFLNNCTYTNRKFARKGYGILTKVSEQP